MENQFIWWHTESGCLIGCASVLLAFVAAVTGALLKWDLWVTMVIALAVVVPTSALSFVLDRRARRIASRNTLSRPEGRGFGELTDFQQRCEAYLVSNLVSVPATLVERRVSGGPDPYIMAQVSGTDLTIYIYEDGASILGPSTDIRFEAPDYANLSMLGKTFVEQVVELLG